MSTTVVALPLIDQLFEIKSTKSKIITIVVASWLMALLAQIKIPLGFTPVPITGQSFGILAIGAALGARGAFAATALYLLQGALGLPFFTNGGGIAYFMGPTGGYLLGFLLASPCVGYLAERGWDKNILKSIPMFLLGLSLVFLFGVTWLSQYFGSFNQALQLGLYPFILGGILKVFMAALLLPSLRQISKKKY